MEEQINYLYEEYRKCLLKYSNVQEKIQKLIQNHKPIAGLYDDLLKAKNEFEAAGKKYGEWIAEYAKSH